MSNVRGCNYYSVKSSDDFMNQMDEEFEFMVTPMVFNVCLKLNCEGNAYEIEKVYGPKDSKVDAIMNTGEIRNITTLFPSKKTKKGTKGGIQLIRLKRNDKVSDKMNVEVCVTFENRNGQQFKNSQFVTFDPPQLMSINDMIDSDEDDMDNNENENFYDNLGIRKGILLCKYVELFHCWISAATGNGSEYKNKYFPAFLKHFEKEKKKCKDDDLQKEIEILKKLINQDFTAQPQYSYHSVAWDIEVENLYYTAEPDIKCDPQSALENFEKCIAVEEANSPNQNHHRFQALKHVVGILFNFGVSKRDEMIIQYKKLMSLADLVSPNDLNNAIRGILNKIQEAKDVSVLEKMYLITIDFFKNKPGKEGVWFEFAMKLCKEYLSVSKRKECELLLDELYKSCKTPAGEDDRAKGAQLLEIYGIKIQFMSATNNVTLLNELFERTKQLSADVNDPRSMSVIKECWGKYSATKNEWNKAYQYLFDAFRNYQDIGHPNVKQCLKYVVIASMLSNIDTNPFATQEAAVFKTYSDIAAIASLLDAFDNDDIKQFEETLHMYKDKILNDEFIDKYMPLVKTKFRSKVLIQLVKPYNKVRLQFLANHLNATVDEVENLLVNLILNNSIIESCKYILFFIVLFLHLFLYFKISSFCGLPQ
eukprot:451481_1